MQLRCAAKINLSLDVTGKRPDGYHTLESIFQTVSVYDVLSVAVEEGSGISLTCDTPGVPCDAGNLAFRAARTFLETTGIRCGIRIGIEKHIPSGAGMGGGSADAAGVLYALNKLLGCGYSNAQLREIGAPLGADVPFLLLGGTAFARGIGEILTPLAPLPEIPLAIVKGMESISTPAAYAAIDRLTHPAHPDTAGMLEAVKNQDIAKLAKACGNLFEEVAADCRDVQRAREALLGQGALCAVMTGSGSAVFGIFASSHAAQRCIADIGGDFAFGQACTAVAQPFTVL